MNNDSWKYWVYDSKNKPYTVSGLVFLAIALPLTIYLVMTQQDQRSKAASPDNLEVEQGILTGNATLENDPNASGGKYIKFGSN